MITLVNPNYSENPLSSKKHVGLFLPNLGLDSIYTNLLHANPNLDLCVVDGVLYDSSLDKIKEKVFESEPRVVGIYSTYMTIGDSLNLVSAIKSKNNKTITTIGGPGAKSLSVLYNDKRIPNLDYLVTGDGERVFADIVQSGKPQNSTIHVSDIITNLDELVFPSRESVDTNLYISTFQEKITVDSKDRRILSIYSSKGCDWRRCTFCSVNENYRTRSPKKISEEIEYLVDNYKIDRLFFTDDNLILYNNIPRIYQISEILSSFPNLEWTGETRIMDIIKNPNESKKFLSKMKESGCNYLLLGVESLDDLILRNIKKGIKSEHVETALQLLNDAGIVPRLLMLYNSPGETEQTLKNSLDKLKRLTLKYNIDIIKFSEYVNIPGSFGYRQDKKGNLSKETIMEFEEDFRKFCREKDVRTINISW